MLPEWYFCCCIDAAPDATNAFLCTLEVFDNPESDDYLLDLAVSELQKMDVWMRIYALPHIVKWRRNRQLSPRLVKQVRHYLDGLLERMPEDYDEEFGFLIDALTSNLTSPKRRIEIAETCAKAVAKAVKRNPTYTPYLDLREFLPETFILAVLAVDSVEDKLFADELSKILIEESSLRALFDAALDNGFGRLAFRLAVRVAVLVPSGYSQTRLLNRVLDNRTFVAEFEPDLMSAAAEIMFLYDFVRSSVADAASVSDQIHLEAMRLSGLRKLIKADKKETIQLLRRFDLLGTKSGGLALPIVFWQATLWELGLHIDPVRTSDHLWVAWRTPGQIGTKVIKPKSPFSPDETSAWRRQLQSLLELQELTLIDLQMSRGSTLPFDSFFEWMFASPWVRRLPKRRSGQYPNAEKPEVLIRLISSLVISKRLLRLLPEEHEKRRFFAAVIAHAHDVLDMFRFWRLNYFKFERALEQTGKKREEVITLGKALTGLTLYGNRQTTLVGTGRLTSAPPDLFLDIIRSPGSIEHKSGEPQPEKSKVESDFHDNVLPKVLLNWIDNAYPAAIEAKLSGLWLRRGTVGEVFSFFNQGHHARDEIVGAALVTRFLSPETPLDLRSDIINWQNANTREQGLLHWRLGARQLLLTSQDLSADAWHHPEWNEPDWRAGQNRGAIIVRALERLSALKNPGTVPPDVLDTWREDWMTLLNSATRTEDIDRHVRLRLLELIEDPVLANSLDGQELIALVLLEYGSTYELMRLFELCFKFINQRLTSTNNTRLQLQVSLLKALALELFRQGKSGAKRRLTERAQDPRTTFIEHQREILIQGWLTRVAFLVLMTPEEETCAQLGRMLIDLFFRTREPGDYSGAHSVKAEVELTDERKKLSWRELKPEVHHWNICAAAYDPNNLAISFLYHDYDLTGIDNLFDHPEIAQEYEDRKTYHVLAVLLDLEDIGQERLRYVFNCGLTYLPTTKRSKSAPLGFGIGDYVSIPIRRRREEGTNQTRWIIPDQDNAGIRRLPRRHRTSDIEDVSIREWRAVGTIHRSLSIVAGKMHPIENRNLRLWDADVSRNFQSFNEPATSTVRARFAEDKTWKPLDLTLCNLLIRGIDRGQKSLTLTFIEEAEDQFGNPAWRFSMLPGENYVISQSEFREDDRELVRLEVLRLTEEADSFGLLLTVKPFMVEGTVLLELVNDLTFEPAHIGLRVPFDYRNIEWRTLFHDEDNLPVASYDIESGGWFYFVPDGVALGYPRKVRINWKFPPGEKETTAEFIPIEWERDCRSGIVRAEHPSQHEVNLNGGPIEDFVDWWLNLDSRDWITIDRPLGKILPSGSGFVSCLSDNNLIVHVEIESLTMAPNYAQTKPHVGRRVCEVIKAWRDKTMEVVLDVDCVPRDAVERNGCKGILMSVPNASVGKVCKAVWITSKGLVPQDDLAIENLKTIRINQGCIIEGTLTPSGVKFVARQPYVRVRALWTMRDLEPGEEVSYLDTTFEPRSRRNISIAESRPGELVRLYQRPTRASHLSKGDGKVFIGGLKEDLQVRSVGRESDSRKRRMTLSFGGKLLTGDSWSEVPSGDLAISGVRVKLFDKGEDLFGLSREFELRRLPSARTKDARDVEDRSKIWRTNLENYLKAPVDLMANFEERESDVGVRLLNDVNNEIRVPVDSNRRDIREWSSWIKVPDGEGVFVVGVPYPRDDAVVRLFESSSQAILASFRRVPAMTPETFRARVGARFFEEIQLQEKMYYVGPEEFDEITGEHYQEVCHRFEVGYGKSVLVPESKLRFKGQKFDRTELLVFHGDAVTGIRFLHQESDLSDSESDEVTVNSIIDISELQLSLARLVFHQRSDYGIVHILRVVSYGESIEIKSVEGFDENQLIDKLRSFDTLRAQLTDDSGVRLRRRFDTGLEAGVRELTIAGRLDKERFEDSLGKEVRFEHVRLSFEDSPLGPALQNGEMIFLQAGRIIRLRNDVAVRLKPPNYFSDEDVGEDFYSAGRSNVLLLRRRFSARENLLTRILDRHGEEALEGRFLLARLSQRGTTIGASLLERPPARKDAALVGKLSRGEILLATVMRVGEAGIQIELMPGVFVRLDFRQIEKWSTDFKRGSIIRIENVRETAGEHFRFRITSGAFADSRYVPQGTRPIVLLPMNNMLDEKVGESRDVAEDKFWENRKTFTVGGMPNLVAQPGSYDEESNRWSPPKAIEIMNVMETPHPKIVRLGQERPGLFIFSPLTPEIPIGKLEIDKDGFDARYVPLTDDGDPGAVTTLRWAELSFADESVRRIISQANRERWKYHDHETGTLTVEGGIQWSKTGLHDLWRGPLFFETKGKHLSLRYSRNAFNRYGFPVEELLHSLVSNHGGVATFSVAGVSDSETGGLWIELAPGRIVELPANRLILKSRARKERSLASLSWDSFAPGDRVSLSSDARNPFVIDRIILEDWKPGPRKAFGPRRVYLPVASCDSKEGALLLGRGHFALNYPVAQPDEKSQTVVLQADNSLEDVTNRRKDSLPVPEDVVLLGLNNKLEPAILGLPKLIPLPSPLDELWRLDDVGARITFSNPKGVSLNYRNFVSLIEMVGALPVTVEAVQEGKLFFSLRHQSSAAAIMAGRVALARLVGLFPDNRTGVLRCGSSLITMRLDRVVSGLPEVCFGSAAEFLVQSGTQIWIRAGHDRTLRAGLAEELSREIIVEGLGIAKQKHSDETTAGMICRSIESMTLFWLPNNRASWAALSADQFRRVFSKRTFRVRLMDARPKTPWISVVDVRETQREFAELTVGKDLTVKVLERTEAADRFEYLVETSVANMILKCEAGDEPITEKTKRVEVLRRKSSVPYMITVVPLGTRPQRLDLPVWMSTNLPDPSRPRDSLIRYLNCRNDPQPLPTAADVNLAGANDETIDQLLCYAFDAFDERSGSIALTINIVREWVKRNFKREEIQLAHAIMAILILNRLGRLNQTELADELSVQDVQTARRFQVNWRSEASELTQNLGRRALRSAHVEGLTTQWLMDPHNRSREGGLWQRLQRTARLLQSPVTPENINGIRQFCYAVDLRGSNDLNVIANALLISLGELHPDMKIQDRTKITASLIRLFKTIPICKNQLWLQDYHVRELSSILSLITANAIDITLLDALPALN